MCNEIAIIHKGGIIARDRKDTLMSGIDSKEVAFTLDTPLEQIPASLNGLEASLRGEKLVVKYKPSESHMDMILTRLREAGLTIRDISTHEVDLEDLFVRLTTDKAA